MFTDGAGDTIATVDTEGTLERLKIGYAWKDLKAHVTEKVGVRAKAILEEAFRFGVAKGGDRRSCIQMEEALANRLPVEERVSRFGIQTWLSSRLTQAKNEKDPVYVRKQAVQAAKEKLFVAAWGFDPTSTRFTKKMIKHRLENVYDCAPKNKDNPHGQFKPNWKKGELLNLLYRKEKVPTGFRDITSFLEGT